ncbi:matrix protein [Schizosaccharomyces octosporus yFS286]|uniref:Matrix protein n=1 Tax=Schizosaccharomyces octosporus (strain yFS286) TaxID=483514 RepID=S9Q6C6_SCHOY|nr:matrix protein [Schizosaccharomyces octosporus yFS286]EPX75178.1 matrix protein [Schizosaccharomyces octosporus yFS286]
MAEDAGKQTESTENGRISEELGDLRIEEHNAESPIVANAESPVKTTQEMSAEELKIELEKKETILQQLQSSYESLKKQHSNLVSKVSGIKITLGERLKKDSQALAQSRTQIQKLEKLLQESEDALKLNNEESKSLSLKTRSLQEKVEQLQSQNDVLTKESQNLNTQVRQWERRAKDEHEMQESLAARLADYEEQLMGESERQEHYQKEIQEHLTMQHKLEIELDNLKEQHLEDKSELQTSYQTSLDELSEKFAAKEAAFNSLEEQLRQAESRISKVIDLEQELREKSLLIGKLQHEAVILNEHLTKALCMLKEGDSSEKIDKQLISNLFVSFLTLPRADTKRFEILQLISSVLGWNDEQKEQAGIQRPGSAFTNWSLSKNSSSNSVFSDIALSKRGSYNETSK